MSRMGESLRSALMAVSVMMVEQLGFEMMPWCSFTSPALISGTTSGTFGSRRKAEELSTNTAPERTIAGAKRSAMSFSAAPRTMSMPAKAASVASSTTMSCPCHDTTLPAERALASRCSSPTGNLRSARIFIISCPTAPLAPRMATRYCFISENFLSYFTKLLYRT